MSSTAGLFTNKPGSAVQATETAGDVKKIEDIFFCLGERRGGGYEAICVTFPEKEVRKKIVISEFYFVQRLRFHQANPN